MGDPDDHEDDAEDEWPPDPSTGWQTSDAGGQPDSTDADGQADGQAEADSQTEADGQTNVGGGVDADRAGGEADPDDRDETSADAGEASPTDESATDESTGGETADSTPAAGRQGPPVGAGDERAASGDERTTDSAGGVGPSVDAGRDSGDAETADEPQDVAGGHGPSVEAGDEREAGAPGRPAAGDSRATASDESEATADEPSRDGAADEGGDGDGRPPETEDDERDVRERIEEALTAVRREGLKAAAVYAAVDAVAVFMVVNMVLVFFDPGWLPARVPFPTAVGETVPLLSRPAVPGSALVAVGAGLATGAGEFWYRTRQSLVEQFEAVNPPVAEALRTARDAVAADADSRMALRLYEDVLAGLRESSSLRLVDWRRVGGTALVAVVVSLATIQVAVANPALFDGPATPTNDTDSGRAQNYTGLKDADRVLGAPESVSTGNRTRQARVESTGGGQELDDSKQFPGDVGGGGGGGGSGSVDSQQAGFAAPERVEDADLVREYNRRIREDADDGDN